ncbi:TIGR01777 family oxidoreductase [Flavobacterium sp. DG1-102-2]|uniref:TIGR01777 family oxidoreductase n=1 Tax=Flavobacterium sp. DG1-102-2 TaxID=3081663 RepID=UPI00294A479D|nr:TIGR01777 family oxidoreductase [Flavobacterium sp. DG1-102-2]MDV6169845.1 TIGR01777 family oxidoreductase [Flavobacterium sp. DG1-102-2]
MKVLITGATGLVGSELVSLLLKNGVHIHYLTTSKDKLQDELNYKGFFWNPEKGIIDESCIDGVDAILHLAGASIAKRWTESYKQQILESRVLSTTVLYGLLKNRSNNVHHFISASATGIYPSSLEKVYSEDDTDFDNSFLSHVVQRWESAVDRIKQLNIRVSKVRTGLVLSRKSGVLKEIAAPARFGFAAAFGSGKQMQSWVHIDDLSGIYHYILNNELEGIYNAVAPFPVDNNKLTKQVAKALDKPYFMPNIPKFAMEAVLGEMHTLLFDSQNVSAKKIIGEGYQFKYLSLEKALKAELA